MIELEFLPGAIFGYSRWDMVIFLPYFLGDATVPLNNTLQRRNYHKTSDVRFYPSKYYLNLFMVDLVNT